MENEVWTGIVFGATVALLVVGMWWQFNGKEGP